jgi:hypothetical protein
MIHEIIGDLDFNNHFWAADKDQLESVWEQGIESADLSTENTFSAVNSIKTLFRNLCQHLEQFEHDSVSTREASLREFNDRLDEMQKTFLLHLEKTSAAVADLSRRIDENSCVETAAESEKAPAALHSERPRLKAINQEPAESTQSPKPGLIRRLFS